MISGRTADQDAARLHELLWERLDALRRGELTLFEDSDADDPAEAGFDPGDARFVIGGRR